MMLEKKEQKEKSLRGTGRTGQQAYFVNDTVILSELLNENPKIALLWSRECKGSSASKAGLLLIHVLRNERIG